MVEPRRTLGPLILLGTTEELSAFTIPHRCHSLRCIHSHGGKLAVFGWPETFPTSPGRVVMVRKNTSEVTSRKCI